LTATVNSSTVVNAGPDLFLCNQPIPETLTGTPCWGTWTGTGITDPSGEFTPNGIGTFTIVYSFSNASGCPASDTILITVGDPSGANAGMDTTVCIDAPNVQLSGFPGGGTWTGNGVNAAGIFDPTVAGTFELVYSVGSGTCQSRDTLLAIVNPLPVVDAGNNLTFCLDGAPSPISGTPAGGTWSGTGITNPLGTFNPGTAGVGTHTLTYTYTDPVTGCTNFDTRNATVNPLPQPNAGNDTTLCNQPIGVQFNGSPAGGVWSGTNVSPTGIFTPTGVGNFTLTYTFTLGTGCTANDQVVVTIIDATQANAGSDLELCIGDDDFTINGTPVGGTWTGSFVTAAGVFTPNGWEL
jgi:large repetitive protein